MSRRSTPTPEVELAQKEPLIGSEQAKPQSAAEAEARLRRRQRYANYRPPPPPKTTLAAVLMLIGGLSLCSAGLVLWLTSGGAQDRERAYAMLAIGGILLLPGSYASLNLFGAYMGWPGYSYDAIPSYDDD